MNYQQKQKWKKKMAGIIAIVMAVILVLGMVAPFVTFGAEVSPITAEASATREVVSLDKITYNTDAFTYLTQSTPTVEMGQLGIIFIMIGVYIVLVGPILYMILKKKDKRDLAWGIIPVCAVVFMVAIFMASQNSGFKAGQVNRLGFVEMQADRTTAMANVGIRFQSPKKGNLIFTSEEVLPFVTEWNTTPSYNADKTDGYGVSYEITTGETTEIRFLNNPSWQSQYVNVQKEVELGGNVTSDIRLVGENYVGELTNGTNVDFADAVLILEQFAYSVGELSAGETLQVNLSKMDIVQGGRDLYYDYDYTAVRDEVKNGLRTKLEGYDEIMKYRFYDTFGVYNKPYFSSDSIQVEFFGFQKESIFEGAQLVNGDVARENDMMAYHQIFSVELAKLENFSMSISSEIKSASKWEIWKDRDVDVVYSETGEVIETAYILPKDVRLDTMKLTASWSYHTQPQFVEVYNNTTGEWDSFAFEKDVPLAPSDYAFEGQVRVRIATVEMSDAQIPKLFITGGGLDA